MKQTLRARGIPLRLCTTQEGRDAVAEANIKIGSSRLRLKLVVMTSRKAMRELCRRRFKNGVASNSYACFQPAAWDCGDRIEVDRRFVGVLVLLERRLSVSMIVHECGHAAFAYAKRMRGHHRWPGRAKCDEEDVCYPVGIFSEAVLGYCQASGLKIHGDGQILQDLPIHAPKK